jgi:hypothetical protein
MPFKALLELQNIHHPAPSERGTKILASLLTLLIMDVRDATYSLKWIAAAKCAQWHS